MIIKRGKLKIFPLFFQPISRLLDDQHILLLEMILFNPNHNQVCDHCISIIHPADLAGKIRTVKLFDDL